VLIRGFQAPRTRARPVKMSDFEMDDDEDDYVYESDNDVAETPRHSSSFAASSGGSKFATPEFSLTAAYTVLNQDTLRREQERAIAEIVELFSVSSFQARRMLMDFNWSKEKLSNAVFKQGTDAVLKSAGAPRLASSPSTLLELPSTCVICADDLTVQNALVNEFCSHVFCRECWTRHVQVQIEEGRANSIRCMMHKCAVVVGPAVTNLISLDKAVRDRFEQAMLSHMVEVNPRVTWCPSQPCCGRAIRVSDSSTSRIDCECACEEVFCFACKDASHSPAPCEWARLWKKLCDAESANATFIARHCKPCPKCGKNIFKQDGCNHVTCTCGQSMCWLCGAATGRLHSWDSIQGHTCGKFRLTVDTDAAAARKKMDKYLHYFEKYDGHMQSLRLAAALKSKVDKTIGELEGSTSALADWLSIGLHQLLRMRRFLAWSYAFAYYGFYEENYEKLKKAVAVANASASRGAASSSAGAVLHLQELYEDLQAVLQQSVERLSKLVEMPSTEMTESTKNDVLNLSSATHKNALALSEYVVTTLFSNGALGLDDPPAYFPIRRMVTGLGATGTSALSPTAFAPLRTAAGGTTTTTAATSKAVVDVVDLTMDDDDDDDDVVPVQRRNRKQARVP